MLLSLVLVPPLVVTLSTQSFDHQHCQLHLLITDITRHNVVHLCRHASSHALSNMITWSHVMYTRLYNLIQLFTSTPTTVASSHRFTQSHDREIMDDTRHSEYVVFDKTLSPIEPVRLPTSKYSRPYPTNRHDSIFASLDDVHPIDLHYSHDQHHHESLDSINAPVHGHDGLSKSSFPSDLPPRSPRRPSPSAKLWSNPKHCRNRPRLKIDPPALIPLAEPSLAQKAQAQQIWTDPQDGRAAWMHALVAFWLVFSCWGLTSIYGVFQAYYYRNPQLSDSISRASISSLAWIGSTQLGLVFLLGLPMGYLVDSGYLISAFRTSSLLFALAVWLTAQCTSWSSLWLVQGLLTGLGAGGVFGCGIAILSTWFSPARISSAMAVGACGSCVGAICFALVTKTLLLHAGFATTMRVLGAIVTTSLVPAQFVFRYRRSQYLPLHTRYRVKRGQTRFRIAIKTFTSWWTKAYTLAAAGMFLTFLGKPLVKPHKTTANDSRLILWLCLHHLVRVRSRASLAGRKRQSAHLHDVGQHSRTRHSCSVFRQMHGTIEHDHSRHDPLFCSALVLDLSAYIRDERSRQ